VNSCDVKIRIKLAFVCFLPCWDPNVLPMTLFWMLWRDDRTRTGTVRSSETSVLIYQTVWRHLSGDNSLGSAVLLMTLLQLNRLLFFIVGARCALWMNFNWKYIKAGRKCKWQIETQITLQRTPTVPYAEADIVLWEKRGTERKLHRAQ